jgi:hypothetical protein
VGEVYLETGTGIVLKRDNNCGQRTLEEEIVGVGMAFELLSR